MCRLAVVGQRRGALDGQQAMAASAGLDTCDLLGNSLMISVCARMTLQKIHLLCIIIAVSLVRMQPDEVHAICMLSRCRRLLGSSDLLSITRACQGLGGASYS